MINKVFKFNWKIKNPNTLKMTLLRRKTWVKWESWSVVAINQSSSGGDVSGKIQRYDFAGIEWKNWSLKRWVWCCLKNRNPRFERRKWKAFWVQLSEVHWWDSECEKIVGNRTNANVGSRSSCLWCGVRNFVFSFFFLQRSYNNFFCQEMFFLFYFIIITLKIN
jgi:hypothetical protein